MNPDKNRADVNFAKYRELNSQWREFAQRSSRQQ
jgi:hypothetical protein